MTYVEHPSAVYQPTLDRIVVFVAGGDEHLYDKYWDGSKWVWEDQGQPKGVTGIGTASPSAVYQSKADRIAVFVVGNDGHLYDKYWDGKKWVWQDQGRPKGVTGIGAASPSAVYQSKADRIAVFVVGNDGHLYDKYWNGSKWVWEDQGLPAGVAAIYSPTAVYESKLDRIIVFVTGNDFHLYDKYWDGKKWVWEHQGVPPGTLLIDRFFGMSAVYQSKQDRIVVFVVGDTGHLFDKYWNGAKWVWEDQGSP